MAYHNILMYIWWIGIKEKNKYDLNGTNTNMCQIKYIAYGKTRAKNYLELL